MGEFTRGFTLVELLVVVVIIGILSVVGISIFTGTREKANDAKKKADVEAIVKAYEVNYDPSTGSYRTIEGSWFASGQVPTPPDGGTYTDTRAGNGFQICANLAGTTPCNSPSASCYCKQSSQEEYISGLPTPTPTPTPTGGPTSTPTPTPVATSTPTPTPTSLPGTCPASGLVAYWKMDEASGIFVEDNSVGTNDGTAINGAAVSLSPNSKIGNARSFNGTVQYINVPDSPAWQFGDFTISAWVRFNALSCGGNWWECAIVAQDQGFGPVNKWIFTYDNAGQVTKFHINDNTGGGGATLTGNGWIPTIGTWYHLAITRSGNSYNFYRQGATDGPTQTNTFVIPNANHTLTIGWGEGTGVGFNGVIDEVGIWNRALTATEVTSTLYNGGAGITCP